MNPRSRREVYFRAANWIFAAGVVALLVRGAPLAAHDFGPADAGGATLPQASGAIWPGAADVRFDNGPVVNSVATGAGGADESVVQNFSLGLSTYGFDASAENGARAADQFTVTAPGWFVRSFVLFAYETGAAAPSLVTASVRLWSGPPGDPGSVMVWDAGGQVAPLATGWTGVYRVDETTSGTATNRAIVAIEIAAGAGIELAPGTYWLDWQLAGAGALSGPFVPPITLAGAVSTGDAMLFGGSAWAPAIDLATATGQGLPFLVAGRDLGVVEVPALAPSGIAVLAMALAALGFRRLASRG